MVHLILWVILYFSALGEVIKKGWIAMSDEEEISGDLVSKAEYLQTYADALSNIDQLHNHFSKMSEYVGYSREMLKAAQPNFIELYDQVTINPGLNNIVSSGYEVVRSIEIDTRELLCNIPSQAGRLIPMTITSGSMGGTISISAYMAGLTHVFQPYTIPNPLPGMSNEDCSTKFAVLDPALARCYDEVWETYYGTATDRCRGAMYLMRQVYDHFFGLLAPDKMVRSSVYWKEKDDEKPTQIYRSERINYAAYTHIKDESTANLYAKMSKHIIELYELLNDAHKRGEYDEDKAANTVLEMDKVLKDWVEVIPIKR
ncbi:MAG: hypothetical protein NTZ74_10515 [Chloroflexi bacterium]|nr:hypothetical protein [Chloroflexota bacterium]